MDAISPERKEELCGFFGMYRWALLQRRAELLAQKHIILQRLEELDDVAAAEQKKELKDIEITLKVIDLAIIYHDSDRGKERRERGEELDNLLRDYEYEGEYEGNYEELRRIQVWANPEIEAIMAAEREEAWQTILANIG